MNLTEARKTLADSVLHVPNDVAGYGGYRTDQLDRALMMALGYFLQETKCQTSSHEVTLPSAGETFDLSDALGDTFLPQQMLRARTDVTPGSQLPTSLDLDFVGFEEIIRHRGIPNTPNARPRIYSFDSPGSTEIWLSPIPDQDYSATFTIWEQLTEWPPGTTAEVVLNVPQAFIRRAIWFGAAAALLYGESGTLYASTGWKMFEELIVKTKASVTVAGSINQPRRNWNRRYFQVEGGPNFPAYW